MNLINATGMAAGYTLGLDKDGREWLVVVRGMLVVGREGSSRRTEKPPFNYAGESPMDRNPKAFARCRASSIRKFEKSDHECCSATPEKGGAHVGHR